MADELDISKAKTVLANHNYQLLDLIGSGAFASVYTVYSLKYHLVFCAKILSSKQINDHIMDSPELHLLFDQV